MKRSTFYAVLSVPVIVAVAVSVYFRASEKNRPKHSDAVQPPRTS